MVLGLAICLFWALVAVVSATPLANLQKRVAGNETRGNETKCDFESTCFNDMIKGNVGDDQTDMEGYLSQVLEESGMTLGGFPSISSPYDEPNRIYCGFFANASGRLGVTLPRCLMETAIRDFCTVPKETRMDATSPDNSTSRGGRWTTYTFTGYNVTGVYVGIELSKAESCESHRRGLYPQSDPKQPDPHCRDMLMGMIVDTCEGDTIDFKLGGAKSDYCETWAVYPLPPSKSAAKGLTSVLTATPGPTAYTSCGTKPLEGVYPTSGTWKLPKTGTVAPLSGKTDSRPIDGSNTMSTTTSSTTTASSTETTDGSTTPSSTATSSTATSSSTEPTDGSTTASSTTPASSTETTDGSTTTPSSTSASSTETTDGSSTTPGTTSASSTETTDMSTTTPSTTSETSTETTDMSTTSGSDHRVKGRADVKRRT